jgi:DNA-binding transcriptional MerR regulator
MERLGKIASFRTYSIGQLCREFGCTTRALRFYEEQGLLFPARRDGQRVYSHKDRTRLGLIKRGRDVGLSIAEIRDLFETYEDEGEAAQNELAVQLFQKRIAALETQRAEIDKAVETLRRAADRLAAGGEVSQAA